MQTEDLENNWKQLALEFIVTFAENGTTHIVSLNLLLVDIGAVMLRKHEKFHSQIGW